MGCSLGLLLHVPTNCSLSTLIAMPPPDAKAAELAKLKNKMLEVESQLREEKKITIKLRETSEKKIQLTMALDAEIASEVESFKWKREKNISDRRFLTDESVIRLQELSEKELHIKHTIAEFDLLVYENELLHGMIKEVSHEQLRYAAIQAKERDKKAQRNFDARIEMEDVHRHTIMGFNNEYQKEAISKMELEASQANSENDRIYTEFDIREAKTNLLIRQQQASYEQLMRARIERDVVKVSVQMQGKGISDLTEQNEVQTSELAEMSAKVQQIREDIRHMRMAVAEKNQLMKQNQRLRDELKPIKERSKHLCDSVTKLCKKLLNEGLDISKKERVFQSSQIAQRIDGISATLVYDTTPVPSPVHSPLHSPAASLNGSRCGSVRSFHDELSRSINRHRNESDAVSEVSGFSLRSEINPGGAKSRRSTADTKESRHGTMLGPTVSSYDELLTVDMDPDMIWKAPPAGAAGRQYHIAPVARKAGANRNIIRQRLKELQNIHKPEEYTMELQPTIAETSPPAAGTASRDVKFESKAKISFSMLNC